MRPLYSIAKSRKISQKRIPLGGSWITTFALNAALSSRPEGRRLGEPLVQLGAIAKDDFYAALSLQNKLTVGKPENACGAGATCPPLARLAVSYHVGEGDNAPPRHIGTVPSAPQESGHYRAVRTVKRGAR
jgi:hypothetical protein